MLIHTGYDYIVADSFLLFYYNESLIYATVFFGMPTVVYTEVEKNNFLRENELLSAESEKQRVVMCGWRSSSSKLGDWKVKLVEILEVSAAGQSHLDFHFHTEEPLEDFLKWEHYMTWHLF